MIRAPLLASLAALLLAACSTTTANAPEVDTEAVSDLEVEPYLGTWYEIAKYPQRFQRGCTCTTANYALRDDGDIRVENRCREDSPSGEEEGITGKAWRPEPAEEPGKLRVQFFWPLSSDYWVIDRGEVEDGRYPWAVVSNDDGGTLWILSRTPELDEQTYKTLLADLKQQGFDLSLLEETRQEGCWEGGDRVAGSAAAP